MSQDLETIALISSLLSGLRHELSNWATVLNLDVDLLEQQTSLQFVPKPDETAVIELKTNLGDLSELLIRLRAYPMPNAQFLPVNMNHVILASADYRRGRAVTTIYQRLPSQSVWVNGDETSLYRVVCNLLENAQEASDRCDRQPVELTLQPGDTHLSIIVADRGSGFTESDLVAGNPFLPNYTTKVNNGFLRGLGLGLFVSRAIVELHGGTIRLQNRVGGGALVTVTLPKLLNYVDDWDAQLESP